MSETRYTSGGPDGWLRARREADGDVVCLPEYLQVHLTHTHAGRHHFTPLEGACTGTHFSVKAGHLHKARPEYRCAAQLRFHCSFEILQYPGGEIAAATCGERPIPVGVHPIQLPDLPHDHGRRHLGVSAYAKNWFYLGDGKAVHGPEGRYLHAGRADGPCIAVGPRDWTALYRYLILCRAGDGRTVGMIEVVR